MTLNEPRADLAVNTELARALLREQHPDLADLPIKEIASGWDNTIFRLGAELAMRVPRRREAASLIEHEQRWLPALAPALPLPIPAPVAIGKSSERFPFTWSVCPWFEGRPAFELQPADEAQAADELGAFVNALHEPAPADAPINPFRGGHLSDRLPRFEDRLAQAVARHPIHAAGAQATWDRAVAAPRWDGPRLWLHGDLHPANVLTSGGRLSAVIDFGDLTAGDPATDLAIAWMLFGTASRARFRRAVACDDATWTRALGWAISLALAFVAGSPAGSPMIAIGLRTLDAVQSEAR